MLAEVAADVRAVLRRRRLRDLDAAAARVNDLLERTEARPRLIHTETGWDLHFHGPDQTVARGWAAGLAAGLALALGSDRGPSGGLRGRPLRPRLHRHVAQRRPSLLLHTVPEPGQGRGPPGPLPALTATVAGATSDRLRDDVGRHRRWVRVGDAQRRADPPRTDPSRDTAVTARPVVLIAEELSPATVEALGPDFEIRHCNGADRAELLPAIADVDAILVRSATKVDAEALAAATRLKVVARAGVGLDNVDVKAATQAGVMVVNAPTSNIVSAAELAVALMLAAARHIAPGPRRAEERRVEARRSTPASSSTRRPSASSASAASACSSRSG